MTIVHGLVLRVYVTTDMLWYLLVEGLLLLLLRWMKGQARRRLNVGNRNSFLRARLMHWNRHRSVLAECRLLWKRIRLCMRKAGYKGKHI